MVKNDSEKLATSVFMEVERRLQISQSEETSSSMLETTQDTAPKK
jgi:hypothetical protein